LAAGTRQPLLKLSIGWIQRHQQHVKILTRRLYSINLLTSTLHHTTILNNNTLSDILSSVPNTSEFNVPTELQRTDDFRSTAPESREEELANTYYSHVDWTRLPLLGGVRNGKGASKSYVWNYGWRMQKKGIIPLRYHWVCTSCHKPRSHRPHNYNVTKARMLLLTTFSTTTTLIRTALR
jgi:hypothetical protein